MKQIIILAVIILMAGTAFAGDPNSMLNPTPWNTTTINIEERDYPQPGGIITIKMWVSKDVLSLASRPAFVYDVEKQWRKGLVNLAAFLRRKAMVEIHLQDSLDYLEQTAIVEKEKREAEGIR